jgi:DNA-binding PucR family transcriptional regulator
MTFFADVAPVALMLADVAATRGWVRQALGGLSVDDGHAAALRNTLRVFLATGSSYTATAERLRVHKNTVQYRVRKAEEAIGGPVRGRESDVELALRVCHALGAPILQPSA